MTRFGQLLTAIVVLCSHRLSAGEVQPATPATIIRLFNGTNLDGFHTWLVDTKEADPRHVFTVTHGMIRISGNGLGYLSTEKEYKDYHLIAEFKWGQSNGPWGDRLGKARDSGIFLHSAGPDGNSYDGKGAFKAAIECNIFQGATGDLLLIRGTNADGSLLEPRVTAEVSGQRDAEGWFTWQKGGTRRRFVRWGRLNWCDKDPNWRDQLDFRGSRDRESPRGEWTRLECICDDQHITVKVNGTVANEVFEVFPSSGKILLQCEGSEIFFRRLELLPIAKPRGPGAASR